MLSEAQLELSAFADHEIRHVGATVSAIGVANPVVFLEKLKLACRPRLRAAYRRERLRGGTASLPANADTQT